MKCQQAKDLIILDIYGELDHRGQAELKEHLEFCPACAEYLEDMTGLRQTMAQIQDPAPPKIVISRIIAHARDEALRKQKSFWAFSWLKVLSAVCIMGITGGLVVYQLDSGQISEETLLARPEKEIILGQAEEKTASEPAPAPKPMARPDRAAGLPDRAPVSAPGPALNPAEKEKAPDKTAPTRIKIETPIPPGEYKTEVRIATNFPKAVRDEAPETKPSTPAAPVYAKKKKAAPKATPTTARPPREAPVRLASTPTTGKASADYIVDLNKHFGAGPGVSASRTISQPDRIAPKDKKTTSGLTLGQKALAAGNYPLAVEHFSARLKNLSYDHPDRPQALLGLAQAYERLGKKEKARHYYLTLADASFAHRPMALRKVIELGQ